MPSEAPRCGNWLLALLFWGGLLAWYACRLLYLAVRHFWRSYVQPRQLWGHLLPDTVEKVIEDFLAYRLSPEDRAWLREEKTPPKWSPQAIRLQNELRERYGLDTWNRRLLRDTDCRTADAASQLLLKRLWERLQEPDSGR